MSFTITIPVTITVSLGQPVIEQEDEEETPEELAGRLRRVRFDAEGGWGFCEEDN